MQFAQEYECDFIGSQNTLISPSKLRQMPYKPPISKKDSLDVYVEPDPKHSYVCIVDVARGRGQDYSAFSIIDVSRFVAFIVISLLLNSKRAQPKIGRVDLVGTTFIVFCKAPSRSFVLTVKLIYIYFF